MRPQILALALALLAYGATPVLGQVVDLYNRPVPELLARFLEEQPRGEMGAWNTIWNILRLNSRSRDDIDALITGLADLVRNEPSDLN